ncbi:uncharacterized protein LOC135835759 [Planococcus citri]|uniref:uncharacterized protein LOC135835759 n=1 Tax=Planococcus citri TaxID=170843 RepID=UPI0031F9CA74
MYHNLSTTKCRPSWKQCALLLILLSHAVFGSPVVPSAASSPLEPVSQTHTLAESNLKASLEEEDVFGPNLDERSDRKKRLLYEALKKAKQAKLLTIGAASANAAKSVGKSIFKTIATLGIKAIIFNFLYQKINQVLDFKTRLLNNLEQKNREQNSQVGLSDSNTAGATVSTTTENPDAGVPEFNPDKVSLQVPETVFAPAFNIANGASQVLGTLIQNTALRIARLFDALKPLLRSSIGFKSKKRETEFDFTNDFDDTDSSAKQESSSIAEEFAKEEKIEEKTPLKSSYTALVANS